MIEFWKLCASNFNSFCHKLLQSPFNTLVNSSHNNRHHGILGRLRHKTRQLLLRSRIWLPFFTEYYFLLLFISRKSQMYYSPTDLKLLFLYLRVEKSRQHGMEKSGGKRVRKQTKKNIRTIAHAEKRKESRELSFFVEQNFCLTAHRVQHRLYNIVCVAFFGSKRKREKIDSIELRWWWRRWNIIM